MAFNVSRRCVYFVYHVGLLCFLLYIATEVYRIDTAGTTHRNTVDNSANSAKLDQMKYSIGNDLRSRNSKYKDTASFLNEANKRLENIESVIRSGRSFLNVERKRRSVIKLEGLQRGLFANFVNRSYTIRHEQAIEELVPSLIALEDIVIRDAQKTKLILQRVNIQLRDLEQMVRKLSNAVDSESVTDDGSNQEQITTMDHMDMDTTDRTLDIYNATEDVDGSGEAIDPGYITVLPPVYNGSQDYSMSLIHSLQPLYIIIEEMETKIAKHDGFTARFEVHQKNMVNTMNRLEDIVNDEQRKLRQIAFESSYHRTKMATIENMIYGLDGSEARLNSQINRLEEEQSNFFDMLDEHSELFRDYKRTIYKTTQTTRDLESADTVHERDTRTIQQNVASLQQMIARIYGTVDSSITDLRAEVKVDFDRLCYNNKLEC